MKKIMAALVAVFAFAFVPAVAFAQEAKAAETKDVFDYKNAFGVFGQLGGECYHYGLQYDRWFDNRMGFSVGGFVVGSTTEGNSYFLSNIEGEFRYALFQDTYNANYSHRFYTFGMLGYWNHYDEHYEHDSGDNSEKAIKMTNNVNLGAGIAYEMIFGKRVSVILNFGIEAAIPNNITVSPMGGTAVKFRW